MERPDQAKFEKFISPLIQYDPIWQEYADRFGYILELNQYRKPGRILRKRSNQSESELNLEYVIELYMEPTWHNEIDFSDNLPYTFTVGAFLEQHGIQKFSWELVKKLADHASLENIGSQLPNYFNLAFDLVNCWSPEYIIKYGKKFEWTAQGWQSRP
jgi:hypothetical protein